MILFNKKDKKIILFMSSLSGLICLLSFISSCGSMYTPPDEYTPDKEIVYLKQKTEFGPIEYPLVLEDPYSWEVNPKIDKEDPDFLNITSFDTIIAPDIAADAQLFLEVKEHLNYIKTSVKYLELKEKLDNFEFVKPSPRKIAKGKKIKTYTNSIEYEYPEVKGATIIYFKNGDYKIELPDGSVYYDNKEGYYFEEDSKGNTKYAVFPGKGQFHIRENGFTYFYSAKSIRIETNHGSVSYSEKGAKPEQFNYYPGGKSNDNHYTFFVNNTSERSSTITYMNKQGLRYDYFPKDDMIHVSYKNEAVQIGSNYEKIHGHFDQEKRIMGEPISLYFPQGIRFHDLDKSLSYSQVKPNWPENYQQKKIGSFSFLYTEKDRNLLSKIDVGKLNTVYTLAKKMTGLSCASGRTIVLPPDLQSYRKLHAGDTAEKLNWYPSGFQGMDIIVMWPASVPRYNMPIGEQYFWEEEFFEILIHELVHLFVGESTGLVNQVPVWLNEGLAMYVESGYSDFSRNYWDITFEVAFKKRRLLSWSDVTTYSTSSFNLVDARTHYAQSYKMTSYLMAIYGKEKVVEYLRLFKKEYEGSPPLLRHRYTKHFEEVFGITWEENVKAFEVYVKEEIVKKRENADS